VAYNQLNITGYWLHIANLCAIARLNILSLRDANYSTRKLLIAASLKKQLIHYNTNKKLRYREEHSASVVLSWCTL